MTDKKFDKDILISLFLNFQKETISWLGLHEQHFSRFVTIIISFLSVSLGLFYHFNQYHMNTKPIAVLPIFNCLFSYVAIRICNRFYKRFLESITIANKLFFLLKSIAGNIDEILNIELKKENSINEPYSNDKYIYPDRWINAMTEYNDSNNFIKSRIWTGVNLWRNIIFIILGIVNFVIIIFILRS